MIAPYPFSFVSVAPDGDAWAHITWLYDELDRHGFVSPDDFHTDYDHTLVVAIRVSFRDAKKFTLAKLAVGGK